jgi:hypothetical protein
LIDDEEEMALDESSLLMEEELEVGCWHETKVRERQTQEIRKNFFMVRL